jgi:response regulator of citrate/malate metabolism
MEKAKSKHDRKVQKGLDYSKLAKIWQVLAEAGDWLHVAEISRRTNIDESTVRWYLDHYLNRAIEEADMPPTIKLRLVRLNPKMTFKSYIEAMEHIKRSK